MKMKTPILPDFNKPIIVPVFDTITLRRLKISFSGDRELFRLVRKGTKCNIKKFNKLDRYYAVSIRLCNKLGISFKDTIGHGYSTDNLLDCIVTNTFDAVLWTRCIQLALHVHKQLLLLEDTTKDE